MSAIHSYILCILPDFLVISKVVLRNGSPVSEGLLEFFFGHWLLVQYFFFSSVLVADHFQREVLLSPLTQLFKHKKRHLTQTVNQCSVYR